MVYCYYKFYREIQQNKHQNLFLFLKIVNIKKKEAAAKKEAGGDEKLLIFFTWPNEQSTHLSIVKYFSC